jgi:putative Mg2+ transporter-C (MgtC) family protein
VFQIPDLGLQLDLAFRLLLASALGAAVGLEREIHDHPAGMRTHVLVAFGSALFTILSIHGFVDVLGAGEGTPPDPTRIAAQVVTGMGFLGAGAILKYGTSIRGLTTAGSLWATSAIGMAGGAGQWIIAIAGTAIVIFSLGPLHWVADRVRSNRAAPVRLRLHLERLEALGEVTRELVANRAELGTVRSRRIGKGSYEVELVVRPLSTTRLDALITLIDAIPGVELLETATSEE